MNGPVESALLQYGVLGIVTIMLMLVVRVLFQQAQKDKDRETARADRNEDALRELNRTVQERVIPAALELLATTKRLVEVIEREQMRREL